MCILGLAASDKFKSMLYFADAESDPMPNLFFSADRKTVKAYFTHEVLQIAKKRGLDRKYLKLYNVDVDRFPAPRPQSQ